MYKRMVAIVLGSFLLATGAHALTLDEARTQGRVGETLNGYLAARVSDQEIQALVMRINQGREAQYQRIAVQNKLTAAEVGRIAGEKLVSRAGKGEFVRGINGQWLQKE
ncbi:amine metabolic protein ydbL [Enterobacterales bacterium CwR94]|nr:amine metabolic protein ydbL [Enterobacterales bacterium CwR94]